KRRHLQIAGITGVGASLLVLIFFASATVPFQPMWRQLATSLSISLCYVGAWQLRGRVLSWSFVGLAGITGTLIINWRWDRPILAAAAGGCIAAIVLGGLAMRWV